MINNIGTLMNEILRDRKNRCLRWALGIFLVIIAGTLVVWLVQWKQNALLRANDQSILESPGADPEIVRISLTDAKSAFDKQEAVFLDVRSSESYDACHIPGTLNIPLVQILDRYQELDRGRWIILYCT
jgi:hypothetical protein